MSVGDDFIRAYWGEITERYNHELVMGRADLAVILSFKNQADIQRSIAEQTGTHGEPAIGAVLRVDRRESIAAELQSIEPENRAAAVVVGMKPPRGTFPIVVILDEGSGVSSVEVTHMAEPLPPPVSYGQRVYRASRESTEVAYLQALARGMVDPVIMVDTRDQDERRERLTRDRPSFEGVEMAHVKVTVGDRLWVADQVAGLSRGAADWIAEGPIPDLPYTVVIVGEGTAEVFNGPLPVAGDGF